MIVVHTLGTLHMSELTEPSDNVLALGTVHVRELMWRVVREFGSGKQVGVLFVGIGSYNRGTPGICCRIGESQPVLSLHFSGVFCYARTVSATLINIQIPV